uniref:hypothetical protein n=1 Tax=Haloprofundus sp. MHR1 TaxID=2572921 RepID=UPI001F1C3987|nr:hypothetical protein [Haloprofundus sp. MHR1]
MTAEDDELQRSTRRLGDRFGAATEANDRSEDIDGAATEANESPEVDNEEPETDSEPKSASPAGSGSGDDSNDDSNSDDDSDSDSDDDSDSESESESTPEAEPDWVPTTLYLPEETRREFRRFLKRLTLDHPEIESAKKRELHTALIQVGMEQSEAVAERTKSLSSDDS